MIAMSKARRSTIEVQGTAITVVSQSGTDHISLTDMAKNFGDNVLIYSWMRNRNTLEFIGIWERIHNPGFKGLEFETFRNQAGLNTNLESLNSVLIRQGLLQRERLLKLNEIAITQLRSLLSAPNVKRLK